MDKKLRTPLAAIMLIINIVAACISLFINTQITPATQIIFAFQILQLACNLALCLALFSKKRDNTLIVILACITLVRLAIMIILFNLYDLLLFISYAFLLIFALSACEQTIIKADLSTINKLAKKIFFLPACIYAIATLYSALTSTSEFISQIFYYSYRFDFQDYIDAISDVTTYFLSSTISSVPNTIIMLSLALWLKDPYVKTRTAVRTTGSEASQAVEVDDSLAYCGLFKHILLCLFTFGIWYLIWTYRTTKSLSKAPNAVQHNPTCQLLLCMFIPYYQVYWFYKHGQKIDAISKQRKLHNSDIATLCLIFGIFIPIVSCVIIQDKINAVCIANTSTIVEETKTEDHSIEQLIKYKELLDSNIITQDEFDAKKKQLLGL